MFKKTISIILSLSILSALAAFPASAEDTKVTVSFDGIKLHSPAGLDGDWDDTEIEYSGNSVSLSHIAKAADTFETIAGIYPAVSDEDRERSKFTHFSFEQTIATADATLDFDFSASSDTLAFQLMNIDGKLAVRLANAYPDIVVTDAAFTDKSKIDWIFEESSYLVDRAFQYIYVNNEFVAKGISEGENAAKAADITVKIKSPNALGISKILWENPSVTFYDDSMTLDDFTAIFASNRGLSSYWLDCGVKPDSDPDIFTVYGKAVSSAGSPSVVALYSASGRLLDAGVCGKSEDNEAALFKKDYDGEAPDIAKMLIFDEAANNFSENTLTVPQTFDSTPIYLLAIGNSFAMDSLSKLENIAKADGVNIRPYTANHSGRPLSGHYESWLGEKVDYQIRPGGSGVTDNKLSMKDFIDLYDWDYITLQGTTHYSAYDEGLFGETSELMWTTLKDAVSENAPEAKRLVHATWTPINELSGRVNDGIFKNGVPDSSGAYLKALLEKNSFGAGIYSSETRPDGENVFIPTLVAVDYLIRHYGFPEYGGELDETSSYDNSETTRCVYRDKTCHLTDNVGRVLAGLVWYETLTGIPATECRYTRSTLSDEDMEKIKAAAHYACENYMTYDPDTIKP